MYKSNFPVKTRLTNGIYRKKFDSGKNFIDLLRILRNYHFALLEAEHYIKKKNSVGPIYRPLFQHDHRLSPEFSYLGLSKHSDPLRPDFSYSSSSKIDFYERLIILPKYHYGLAYAEFFIKKYCKK